MVEVPTSISQMIQPVCASMFPKHNRNRHKHHLACKSPAFLLEAIKAVGLQPLCLFVVVFRNYCIIRFQSRVLHVAIDRRKGYGN